MAPEISMVRTVTRRTLIPAYRAVFSLSPTTEISYPLLGEPQVGVHDEGQHNDNDDVDRIALAQNDREPARLGGLVQRCQGWTPGRAMMLVMQATIDVAT